MRTLIHEVVADIDDAASEIVLIVHWVGGAHSELRLPKRRRGQRNSTSADIIQAVRQLVLIAGDDLIAGLLNRNGLKTGNGNRWTRERVTSMRSNYSRASISEISSIGLSSSVRFKIGIRKAHCRRCRNFRFYLPSMSDLMSDFPVILNPGNTRMFQLFLRARLHNFILGTLGDDGFRSFTGTRCRDGSIAGWIDLNCDRKRTGRGRDRTIGIEPPSG